MRVVLDAPLHSTFAYDDVTICIVSGWDASVVSVISALQGWAACHCSVKEKDWDLELQAAVQSSACSVGSFVSSLVREEVLLAGLYERRILFRLEIYDRLREATAK